MDSLDIYQIYRNSENFAAILLSNNLLCNIALAAGTLVELSVKAAVPPKGPIGFCLPSTPSRNGNIHSYKTHRITSHPRWHLHSHWKVRRSSRRKSPNSRNILRNLWLSARFPRESIPRQVGSCPPCQLGRQKLSLDLLHLD